MNNPQENTETAGASWFYEQKGQRIGGVDENTLISLIKTGQLGYGSKVWRSGFADWMRLEDTQFLDYLHRQSPPPLSGESVSNTLVWVLAFAPFLGLALEGFVAMIVYGDEDWAMDAVYSGQFFYITIALNLLLSFMDEKRLKKAGHDTSKFKGWVWLVPVYLYQRAKQLKQNLAYFIVWVCCFVVILLGLVAGGDSDYDAYSQTDQSQMELASSSATESAFSGYATLGDVTNDCKDKWMQAYREEVGPQAMINREQLKEWEDWCNAGNWP